MLKYLTILFLTFTSQATGQSQKPITLELDPEHWLFQEGKVEFLDYKGRKAIKLNAMSGEMFYRDLNFTDGTIEFDVEVDQAGPFPSIYFRAEIDSQSSEHVYLRTGTAARSNAVDAVQYASIINRVNLWDLQHEFQTAAEIRIGEWNHVKLVVSGKQLLVYVNNPNRPNLEIPCMEGNTNDGRVGIGTGFPGQAVFTNIVIKPGVTADLSPKPGADLTRHDTRYLRHWEVSQPQNLDPGKEINTNMLPPADSKWEPIETERRGLLNLSRIFGISESRRMAWVRAVISSDFDQRQLIDLGFSDEIWVFLNGNPVYIDKNLYAQNMRKSPNGRISLENSTFLLPLVKGENELLIAVANDFYGWGIIARIKDLDGLKFQ